jgi:hypothetical protein
MVDIYVKEVAKREEEEKTYRIHPSSAGTLCSM